MQSNTSASNFMQSKKLNNNNKIAIFLDIEEIWSNNWGSRTKGRNNNGESREGKQLIHYGARTIKLMAWNCGGEDIIIIWESSKVRGNAKCGEKVIKKDNWIKRRKMYRYETKLFKYLIYTSKIFWLVIFQFYYYKI